eukprot:m.129827 g.129827  ORF g.129827 m.129827 type:complete len:898 (-) comp29434_c0_seq1:80-2773(-)
MTQRKKRGIDAGSGGGLLTPTVTAATIIIFWLIDIGTNVTLVLRDLDWCAVSAHKCGFSIAKFGHMVLYSFGSKHGVMDLLAMLLLRILVGVIAWLTALRIGRASKILAVVQKKEGVRGFKSINSDIESQPLLQRVEEVVQPKDIAKLRENIARKKSTIVAITFLLMTAIQVYVGIKCVSYDYQDDLMAALMCITVGWINIELYLIKSLVEKITNEDGYIEPKIHHHPLHYVPKLPLHNCDRCRAMITAGAFRCKSCDFDCCEKCFRKRDASKAEDQVRGDKGVREVKEIKTSSYTARALKLTIPHWPFVVVAIVCVLCAQGASLLMPHYNGKIIDRLVNKDIEGFRYDITITVVLAVATGLFGSVRTVLFRVVGAKIANTVRKDLFHRLLTQDVAYYDGSKTGDLCSRLSGDVGSLVSPMQGMIGTLLSSTVMLIGGVVMCFYTCWRLSIIAVATIAPIMYLTDQYARFSRRLNFERFAALGEGMAVANEALNNIRTVKAFSTESLHTAQYWVFLKVALGKSVTDAIANAAQNAITSWLDLGGTVLILWYGGDLVLNGGVSVGTLISFRLYWGNINSAYKSLMSVLNSFTRAGGAAQRVLSLMDNTPDIPSDSGEKIAFHGDIEFQNVSFHYQMRPNNKVLKGISLKIPKGNVCALVGRSGGGKSTIAHMLMRFYDPTEGKILIDGQDLTTLNLKTIHDQCGLVAQESQLFASSIRDNISYGLEDKSEEDIIQAAKDANAHDFIVKFDDGYDTKCGERGVRLSGGQKQRIALARVFLRKPRLLLLDEATSALDAESEAQVQEALDRLISRGDSTVLLIAHRLSTVMDADKIAVVDDGKIIEEGNHSELVALDGVYAKLVARQMRRQANQIEVSGAPVDSVDSLMETESEKEKKKTK